MQWWLRPAYMIAFFIFPLFILVPRLSNLKGGGSYIVGGWYLDESNILLGAGLLLAFMVPMLLYSSKRGPVRLGNLRDFIPDWVLDFAFLLSLVGYAVWFVDLFYNPRLVVQLMNSEAGATYSIRESIHTVAGVTTLTQVGISFSCLYSAKVFASAHNKGRHKAEFIVLLLLSLFRSFAWSERLAIIEYIFPFAIYWSWSAYQNKPRLRVIIAVIPYLSIFLVLVIFGIFEYNRSWISHYVYEYDSYSEFVVERVLAYYSTALNNGAGLIEKINSQDYPIFYTAQILYKMPGVGEFVSQYLNARNPTYSYLLRFGNPELNNMSGIYTVYFDWGWFSIIIFLLYGAICGKVFGEFIRNPTNILAAHYPVFLLSILEILRINYIFSVRVFPVYVFIIIIVVHLNFVRKRREENGGPSRDALEL